MKKSNQITHTHYVGCQCPDCKSEKPAEEYVVQIVECTWYYIADVASGGKVVCRATNLFLHKRAE